MHRLFVGYSFLCVCQGIITITIISIDAVFFTVRVRVQERFIYVAPFISVIISFIGALGWLYTAQLILDFFLILTLFEN